MRTELHFHLLPGIDDGPSDDEEAIELARLATADGTGRIVATPHVRFADVANLPAQVARLQALLDDAGVGLEVCAGGELSPDDARSASQDELELLAQGPPDQLWLLLEAPLFAGQPEFEPAADELRRRGFGVLIGHPERSPGTSAAVLRRQVARGAVLQLNASSLTGGHGGEARAAAIGLVRSGLPFVVASDAHSRERPPLLTAAARVLADAGVEPAVIHAALDVLPEALLTRGLAAAHGRWPSQITPRRGGSRRGQSERAGAAVARATQIFLDRRRRS